MTNAAAPVDRGSIENARTAAKVIRVAQNDVRRLLAQIKRGSPGMNIMQQVQLLEGLVEIYSALVARLDHDADIIESMESLLRKGRSLVTQLGREAWADLAIVLDDHGLAAWQKATDAALAALLPPLPPGSAANDEPN